MHLGAIYAAYGPIPVVDEIQGLGKGWGSHDSSYGTPRTAACTRQLEVVADIGGAESVAEESLALSRSAAPLREVALAPSTQPAPSLAGAAAFGNELATAGATVPASVPLESFRVYSAGLGLIVDNVVAAKRWRRRDRRGRRCVRGG